MIGWLLCRGKINDSYNSYTRLEEPNSPGHIAWLMRLFLDLLNSWCFISRGDQLKACLRTVRVEENSAPFNKITPREIKSPGFLLDFLWGGSFLVFDQNIYFFLCISEGAVGEVLAVLYVSRNKRQAIKVGYNLLSKSHCRYVVKLIQCLKVSFLSLKTFCRVCHHPVCSLILQLTSL